MSQPAPTRPMFPKAPLIGMFAMAGLALAAAAAGRLAGADPLPPRGSEVLARTLQFQDRADGAVVVRDVAEGRIVEVLVGEQGFIRGTLRGLARTRRSEGVGPQAPFRLIGWSSGRLTLDDPATGRSIELDAFGTENTAAFARLLTVEGHAS